MSLPQAQASRFSLQHKDLFRGALPHFYFFAFALPFPEALLPALAPLPPFAEGVVFLDSAFFFFANAYVE
jgi:hypothetical protein